MILGNIYGDVGTLGTLSKTAAKKVVDFMARKKLEKSDGFGPKEKKRVREAVRKVWHQCHARNLVKKRCIGIDGFPICEGCNKKVPHITVDHIRPVGIVDEGFLARMFVSSRYMQGLCVKCHRAKTNKQRKKIKKLF